MADTRSEHNGIRTRLLRRAPSRLPRVDELLDLALKRGRRRDFADRSFIRPFERLLEACNAEADLSVLGIRALRVDVLRFLRNLLRFEEVEAACPSILSRPIQAPVAGARYRRHGRGVTYVWIHGAGRRRSARGELYARRRGVRDSSRRSDSRLVCAPRPGSGARSRDAGDRRSRRHQLCSPALTVPTRAGAGSRVPQTQLLWLRDQLLHSVH
jgi:hypothetical protein